MIVGNCFPGDENKVLKWLQHDLYMELMGNLFYTSARRYLELGSLLQEQTEWVEKINSIKGFDHRVLQQAHDIIAAYFRLTFDPGGQFPVPFDDKDYKKYLKDNWVQYYSKTCRELAESDQIAWDILQAVLNKNTKVGYAAEEQLAELILDRFPIPGFRMEEDQKK
jgi:hypothetical protein